MKELVFPRFLLPRAERLADKVAFVDVTRDGVRYEGTFATHVDRLLRLTNAMGTASASRRATGSWCSP